MSSRYVDNKIVALVETFKEDFLELVDDEELIEVIEESGYVVYDPDDESKGPAFLEKIEATLNGDVEELLDEVYDLITRGEIGDAQNLIDKWRHPKFESTSEAKKNYERTLLENNSEKIVDTLL